MPDFSGLLNLSPSFYSVFMIHFLSVMFLVRFLYFPTYQDRDFAFSFIVFGLVVFLVTFFLKDANISMGFSFGLFALFGILRYRTEAISTKEMTFLFVVIGLAMINAVGGFGYLEGIALNILVIFLTWFAQGHMFLKQEYKKSITFEKIELIHPSQRAALLADLRERTGLNISRVEIGNVDYVRDIAKLRVFYAPDEAHASSSFERNYAEASGD